MIPAYRRHTVRCVACAVPEVTARCPRCLVDLCEDHAPQADQRCGTCEAEWVFGQVERDPVREEIVQPLLFAAVVSAAFVAGVVSSWPAFYLTAAGAVLVLGAWVPRFEAEAKRRSFLRETFDKTR